MVDTLLGSLSSSAATPAAGRGFAPRKDKPRLIRTDGKRRRRSRNDTNGNNNNGRVFNCKDCGRTYLSNSALFNHRRIKHVSLRHTTATPIPAPGLASDASSGGGGIQRKLNSRAKENGKEAKSISHGLQVRAVSASYFDTAEARGGPTEVIHGFQEAYELLLKGIDKYEVFEKHPLYVELVRLHDKLRSQSQPAESAKSQSPPAEQPPQPPKTDATVTAGANQPPDKEIKPTHCDAVFAEYLAEVARKINKSYFKKLVRFVLMYRECLNEYGFIIGKTRREAKFVRDQEYCQLFNTELAPEICNEVVAVCLDQPHMDLSHKDAVALTLNFCNWLLANDYTSMMLTLGRRV